MTLKKLSKAMHGDTQLVGLGDVYVDVFTDGD